MSCSFLDRYGADCARITDNLKLSTWTYNALPVDVASAVVPKSASGPLRCWRDPCVAHVPEAGFWPTSGLARLASCPSILGSECNRDISPTSVIICRVINRPCVRWRTKSNCYVRKQCAILQPLATNEPSVVLRSRLESRPHRKVKLSQGWNLCNRPLRLRSD
jgi:hypothetical protein